MANQKEYKIIINGITESIEGIGTLQDSLDKLGSKVSESGGHFKAASSSMDELAKTEQKITEYNKEYQTALAANKAVLADNAKEIKNKLDLEKAELIVSEDLRETYAQKQQLLTAMGKVIKNTAGDTTELQQKYAELNQELKDFDATLGNHQRNVGDYGQATKNLKQELREFQLEMANMLDNGVDKADPKFVELAKKAGALKDAMADAGEEINRFASDTKKIDDVINIAQSATAAFELYKGAMSAFGLETEETEKAIQKLMGAMSIIQSLKTLSETLQNGSMTAKLFNNSLGLLTKGMQGASLGAKALRIALASIGIGIIIGLVSLLVEHWEDLVGWFNKTFPALKKLGGAMNALKAVFVGFGKAIVNWVTNPLKTFANVIQKIFQGDFKGAMQAVTDGIKNQFKGTADAFKSGFQTQVKKGLEDITAKTAAEAAKQTKYELDMLKARKGNQAKYSREGIALQKKEFEQRKKAAKGNEEELKKIALDEANFFRECEEQKTAATKKSVAERTRVNKAAADAAEEEAKRQKEAAEYKAKADEALYRSTVEYLIKQKEKEIEYYEAEVKMYSAGPVEKYQEAVEKVNTATEQLVTLQRQLHLYDFFNDYKQNIDASADSLKDFMGNMNVLVEQFKLFGGEAVSVEEFGVVAKQLKMFSNLSEDQLKYLYHIYIDYLKDGLTETKTIEANILAVQEEQLRKEMEGIEKTTLKYELESDKKSETAQALAQTLNTQWDNYLEHVKQVYREDSIQYLKAQKAKEKALNKKTEIKNPSPFNRNESKTKGDDVNGGFGLDPTNWSALWDEDGPVWQNMGKLADMMFDNVFDPIADGFSALLEFEIEEAQEALDKATEMHDKSVDAVAASNDRIADIKNQMTNANASQLEKLKEQQADEMVLLAQKEAEEKRLAREKEKREKELEKKQKQQRKLELRMQMIESIVNTAVSVTKALTWGWPLGTIFAAIIGAMGAMQTAIIAKQISKLADGGVLGGKSHAQGGVKIPSLGVEVEKGEAVINKRSTAKYLPLLDAINAEGNGGKHTLMKTRHNVYGISKFADGGVLNYQRIDDNFKQLDGTKTVERAIQSIDIHPQVSVVDINRGQKNLTQVRQMAGASR